VERAAGAQAAGGAPEDQDPPSLAVLVPAAEGEVVAAVAVEVAGGDRAGGAAERRGAAVAVVDGQLVVDGGRLGLVAGLVVAAAVVADRDVPGAVAVEVAERGRRPVIRLAARPFEPAGPGAEQPGGGLLAVVGLVHEQPGRPPAVDPVGGQPPELLARRRRLDGPAGRFPVTAERAVEDDQLRREEAAFRRGRHRHVREAVAVEIPGDGVVCYHVLYRCNLVLSLPGRARQDARTLPVIDPPDGTQQVDVAVAVEVGRPVGLVEQDVAGRLRRGVGLPVRVEAARRAVDDRTERQVVAGAALDDQVRAAVAVEVVRAPASPALRRGGRGRDGGGRRGLG